MEKVSLSLIEGRGWWQQQLGSAWAPVQQHLQEDALQHISVQMCAKPEQNLTLSMCSMLFALDLYFCECGLSSASSRFTALPYQNLPGLGLLFRLAAGTTKGSFNAEHRNLQQPEGAATWRCTSILGKVFSQCRDRGVRYCPLRAPRGVVPKLTVTSGHISGWAAWYCVSGYSQHIAGLDISESCIIFLSCL